MGGTKSQCTDLPLVAANGPIFSSPPRMLPVGCFRALIQYGWEDGTPPKAVSVKTRGLPTCDDCFQRNLHTAAISYNWPMASAAPIRRRYAKRSESEVERGLISTVGTPTASALIIGSRI